MVTIEAVRPLTVDQAAAIARLVAPRCAQCAAGQEPIKMRGGRQYVHYDRGTFKIVVCTEAQS